MTQVATEMLLAERGSARSDASLVRDCLNGDEEAWVALLERYKRLIYSIPVKYGFSADEASDIFQDTCVELLAALPRLRDPQALPKWLMQVTAHKCAQRRKHDRRDRSFHGGDERDTLDEIADDARRSDEILVEVEREQALRDACSELPSRCRSLVHMLFFETPARPYKEIAAKLQIACGSIGFIRSRCLQRLRTQLHKHGF